MHWLARRGDLISPGFISSACSGNTYASCCLNHRPQISVKHQPATSAQARFSDSAASRHLRQQEAEATTGVNKNHLWGLMYGSSKKSATGGRGMAIGSCGADSVSDGIRAHVSASARAYLIRDGTQQE